jgi:hypothetical protein
LSGEGRHPAHENQNADEELCQQTEGCPCSTGARLVGVEDSVSTNTGWYPRSRPNGTEGRAEPGTQNRIEGGHGKLAGRTWRWSGDRRSIAPMTREREQKAGKARSGGGD